MTNPFYIVDTPLPLSENFKALKDEGLAYIQLTSGKEWTNLNPSDPGVTILDQLCYALTELGYCTAFSIADILTAENGKIKLKDQFFLPEEILTTAPVTITDYRKYLIDGVDGISNALFVPAVSFSPVFTTVYKVYLLPDRQITSQQTIEELCFTAFFYLNKSRNLGEFFTMPVPLVKSTHLVAGRIDLEKQTDAIELLNILQDQVRNYILPVVEQKGYNSEEAQAIDVDRVFNGPYLPNGWIMTADLGEKQDKLNIVTLNRIILSTPGIISTASLNFDGIGNQNTEVSCDMYEILDIDLVGSVEAGLLEVYSAGVKMTDAGVNNTIKFINHSITQNPDLLYGAKADIGPQLPIGKYRDINSYYSIQNTFPEIFAVGENSIDTNASNFQIAQSRQLKGYLTLFDQLLANQFSQLANVDKLLSFKNPLTGTPSDKKTYYDLPGLSKRMHAFPVPYNTFSPTYFYQSLYNIPFIRPLLKNYELLRVNFEPGSETLETENGWHAYKLDPYNPYIHGLMDIMEDDDTSVDRRNALLDHLLARHGESPEVIEAMINGSSYAGDSAADRVIFKSIYLQNLGLISYNRQKAYNFAAAMRIPWILPQLTAAYEEKLEQGDFIDFVFNTTKVNTIEHLRDKDVVSYSAIELKLSMLLGLKPVYKDFILSQYGKPGTSVMLDMCLWMIESRKGLLFFETGILFSGFEYELFITNDPEKGQYWKSEKYLPYTQVQEITRSLGPSTEYSLDSLTIPRIGVDGSAYVMKALDKAEVPGMKFKQVPGTGWFFSARSNTDYDIFPLSLELPAVVCILPSFIPLFTTTEFKERLHFLLDQSLPVQTTHACFYASELVMLLLIPLFAAWHNAYIYSQQLMPPPDSRVNEYAEELIKLFEKLQRLEA